MNKTIEKQLNHKSIRKFKNEALDQETVSLLVDVARHTSTSNFMQSYSIMSITDPQLKKEISKVCKQSYVAESGHLFIFLIDQHRNAQIAKEHDVDTDVLGSFDRFQIASSDALLAAQNTLIAAESMDLGGVLLGSVLNDAQKIIELLNLPKYVFPIIGLALGYPDQTPQLKPRLPQAMMHYENTYPEIENYTEKLADYDEIVQTYYDLRDANRRVDAFTSQINQSMSRKPEGRMALLEALNKQGLLKF